MGCCGNKRRALRIAMSYPPADPPKLPLPENPTVLSYVGDSSIVVKGTFTGQTYLFGPRRERLAVDHRDAPSLLGSGWFVKMGTGE